MGYNIIVSPPVDVEDGDMVDNLVKMFGTRKGYSLGSRMFGGALAVVIKDSERGTPSELCVERIKDWVNGFICGWETLYELAL
ncbi:MAG: hypothetical protein WC343_00820 [Bacilli bacterium]